MYSPGIRMKTQWFLEILGLEDLLSHRKKDFARFMQTALKHLLSPVLENHEKLSWGTDSSHPKGGMLSFIELTNAVSLPYLTRKLITCHSSQHRNVCPQMTWSFFFNAVNKTICYWYKNNKQTNEAIWKIIGLVIYVNVIKTK